MVAALSELNETRHHIQIAPPGNLGSALCIEKGFKGAKILNHTVASNEMDTE